MRIRNATEHGKHKKVSATEHGSADLSAQLQNEHSGHRGVEKVGIGNATKHEKLKKNEHHGAWECQF